MQVVASTLPLSSSLDALYGGRIGRVLARFSLEEIIISCQEKIRINLL